MNEELKAVIAHHITIMMEAQSQPAGGGPTGSGGGGPETRPDEKPDPDKGANKKTALGGLKKLTGLSFTAAGLLKQSQVFTGVVGSIYQLIGAMIDVILAPLLPIMLPAIKFMASLIPIISEKAKIVADKIIGVVSTLGDFYSWVTGKLPDWDWLSGGDEKIKNGIKNALATMIVGAFYLKLVGGLKTVGIFFKGIVKGALLFIKPIVALLKGVVTSFKLAGKLIAGTFNWLTKGGLSKFITKVLGFFNKIIGMVSKIPGVGKAIGAVGGAVKGLFGKVAGKVGAVGGAKAALRGLAGTPVLGAVATAAFGAIDTAKAFKEHGMKAGLATGLAAVAGTAVSLLPVPGAGILGMVVQKGGAVAAEQLLSDKVTITNNVSLSDKDGRETTTQWIAEQDAKAQHEMTVDASTGMVTGF